MWYLYQYCHITKVPPKRFCLFLQHFWGWYFFRVASRTDKKCAHILTVDHPLIEISNPLESSIILLFHYPWKLGDVFILFSPIYVHCYRGKWDIMTTLKIASTFCTVKIFSNGVLNGWIGFTIIGFAIRSINNNRIFKHTRRKGVIINIQSSSANSVKHFPGFSWGVWCWASL